MSQEKLTSGNIKVYSSLDKAHENIDKHQLHDVCRIVGENFQFYILMDDIDGNKFWSKFDGVHKEEAIHANKAFKAGQQKFRDDPLSAADVEQMRNIMTAVATLSVLFEYSQEDIEHLTGNAIVKFAFDLYKRDLKKPDSLKLQDMPADDVELAAYVTKVSFVFEEYSELLNKVKASVEEATTEINKLPDEGAVNG